MTHTKNDELLPFKSYSAGHLFFLAKQAYERTKGEKSDREPGKSDAIVSIIFSASSLEAFINELSDMASDMQNLQKTPIIVQNFSFVMKELEESKVSVRLKFLLTKLIFTGETYDKGGSLFQDFSLLFKIRDSLVHLKPQDEFKVTPNGDIVRIMTPKILEGLPKNTLAKYNERVVADWIGSISTQAVARWACNTTTNMVHSILSILPDSLFKKQAIASYNQTFQPLE